MHPGHIAVRAVCVYLYLLVMTRLSGKRSVSQSTPIDCMVALIVGDLIDDALWAEVSMATFGAAAGSIVACDLVASWVSSHWRAALHLLEGRPAILVRDGEPQAAGLRSEQISDEELRSLLRLRGIEDLRDVHLALAERGHGLSVLLTPEAQHMTRSEAEHLR